MVNENRAGYKKTKLGWIPEEWEVVRFGDVSDISSGGTPNRKVKEYWTGGYIPWVTTSLVNFNIINSAGEFITKEGLENSSAKLFPKGTIVMAIYGQGVTRGKVGILGIEAATNQACLGFKINSSMLDTKFIFYFFKKSYFKLRNLSNDGGQKNLSSGIIKSIKVLLPSITEQKKIAQILSTWDKAIEQTQSLIEQMKLRKKGLMQQLLTGERRLPGFEEKWENKRIGDIFDEVRKRNDGGEHEPLTISARIGFISQRKKFDRVIAGGSLAKYIQLKKGDFSYNKGNSKLYKMGCVFLLKEYDSAVVPFVYISFRPKTTINADFYKFFFENHGLDRQLQAIITSGARGDGLLNVNKKDFFSLIVPFPKLEEQSRIGEILNVATADIEEQENYLAILKAQKKGLMQQLLTGQVRVRVTNL